MPVRDPCANNRVGRTSIETKNRTCNVTNATFLPACRTYKKSRFRGKFETPGVLLLPCNDSRKSCSITEDNAFMHPVIHIMKVKASSSKQQQYTVILQTLRARQHTIIIRRDVCCKSFEITKVLTILPALVETIRQADE